MSLEHQDLSPLMDYLPLKQHICWCMASFLPPDDARDQLAAPWHYQTPNQPRFGVTDLSGLGQSSHVRAGELEVERSCFVGHRVTAREKTVLFPEVTRTGDLERMGWNQKVR